MRSVRFSRVSHFRGNQFAVSGHRQSHPLGLISVVAHGDQIKAARGERLTEELLGHVTDGYDAAAPQNHALKFRRAMRKAKDAARGHQLRNLHRSNGKATLTKPQKNERLRSGFDGLGHSGNSIPSPVSSPGIVSGTTDASSSANSSAVRNPSGFTTGITF